MYQRLVSGKVVNVSVSSRSRPFTTRAQDQFSAKLRRPQYAIWMGFRRCKPVVTIAHHINTLKTMKWKITSRPVIAINNTCTSTSRWSRLESYKRLVSVSSRNFNVSSRSCLGLELLGLVPIPAECKPTLNSCIRFVWSGIDFRNLPSDHSIKILHLASW